MSIRIGNRPLLYRIYDDSDDEDRDDFVVKEVRCCGCFFDMIIKVIGDKKELTFNFFNEKVFMPRKLRFRKRDDIFFLFSEICVFTCEKYKNIFENLFEIDKNEMDKNCLAEYVDFNCLYFLSRETLFFSICDGCRRTLIKEISSKLIKIKL